MYPAPREMRLCRLPYTWGVCTNATVGSAKNGTVSCRKFGSATKSASKITNSRPVVIDNAWLTLPAFACALPSRAT